MLGSRETELLCGRLMMVGVVVGGGALERVEVQNSQHNRDVVCAKLL